MNEDKIIALYQEFAAGIKRIQTSGYSISPEQKKKLADFQIISNDLLEKAKEAGFGDKMVANKDVTINESDDFHQIIDVAIMSPTMKNAMKKALKAWLNSGNKMEREGVWDVVERIDEYYKANVVTVSAVVIPTRMKGRWKEIFGEKIDDLELVALAYQDSAEKALLTEIRNLNQNRWKAVTTRISAKFEENLKGKTVWLRAADRVDNAKVQLKIDLLECDLTNKNFKYLALKNGKVQLSGKLGFTKPVLVSAQKKIMNDYINFFAQGIRNTITANIKEIAEKGLFQKGSSTMGTVGATLTFGYLTITFKIDVGKTSWSESIEKAKAGNLEDLPASWAVRLNAQFNIKEMLASSDLKNGINGTVLNDSLCQIAISGGWDLLVNWTSFADVKIKKQKEKNKKLSPEDKLKAIEKDNDVAKKVKSKQDDLTKRANKLTDAIDKKDMNAMKQAANEMKETAKDIQDLVNQHDFHDPKIHKSINEGLEEAGEVIYKKLAGPISKMSKAFKYAAPFAKLMPGVNAIFTIIEVTTYIIAFVTWFNNVNANSWEDYFVAAGEHMSKNYGGWFKWLDKKLSQ
jgi:hypothetical protein